MPATFWATGFLLLPENAHHRAAVLAELQVGEAGKAGGGGGEGEWKVGRDCLPHSQ